jgi:hypothetical protein
MKTTITFLAAAALTASVSATKIKEESHEVSSTNGKYKLHVDVDTHTHKITKVTKDSLSDSGWQFQHDAQFHSAFISDGGQDAAVVHWAWCKEEDLDQPVVVIYSSVAEKFGADRVKDGEEICVIGYRPGIKRSYTYRQLSKPRERKPDEVGPIGDFWRVWRGGATIKENILTINVEGAEPVVIDLVNPPDLPAQQPANKASDEAKDTQKPGEADQE